jgi:DNA polymerase-3 subunit chi
VTQVDFYVVAESSEDARLRTACRLAEKTYLSERRAVVFLPDPARLERFDEMLWTFSDRSFVPHERLASDGQALEAPVLLSAGALPAGALDVLINLDETVPAFFERFERVAEIVDGDAGRRAAGRARFRVYRDRGIQPASHELRGESQSA